MRTSRWLGLASAASVVAAACGGSQNSAPAPFAQADLVGDWRYSTVFHGAGVASGAIAGWERGAIRVSDAGAVSVLSAIDSAGNHPASLPSPWTIDISGSFTAPPGSTVGFHGKLNSGRTFAAATATPGSGVTSQWVFQKVIAGSSFGASDLVAKSFRYHEVSTGSTASWEHGDATTDDSGRVSLTSRVSRAGPQPDAASFARMSMAPDGTITLDTDASWSGTLSADKAVLIATHTVNAASHDYALQVALRAGPSFAQGDLAGRWTAHDLVASGNGAAGWSHGVFDVDATGGLTFLSLVTNAGVTTTPGPSAFALATDGTVSRATPVVAKFHGTMAPSKDIVVRTDTVSTGIDYAALAFWVK